MPIYEYQHVGDPCDLGHRFEVSQSIDDTPLAICPGCGRTVKKLISLVGVNVSKSNSELRDLGFTKLVRRDDGVYENVTARDGDSRFMKQDHTETIPDISKTLKQG